MDSFYKQALPYILQNSHNVCMWYLLRGMGIAHRWRGVFGSLLHLLHLFHKPAVHPRVVEWTDFSFLLSVSTQRMPPKLTPYDSLMTDTDIGGMETDSFPSDSLIPSRLVGLSVSGCSKVLCSFIELACRIVPVA